MPKLIKGFKTLKCIWIAADIFEKAVYTILRHSLGIGLISIAYLGKAVLDDVLSLTEQILNIQIQILMKYCKVFNKTILYTGKPIRMKFLSLICNHAGQKTVAYNFQRWNKLSIIILNSSNLTSGLKRKQNL